MASLLNGIAKETCKGSGGVFVAYITELANVSGASITNGVASFSAVAGVFKKFVLGKEAGSNFVSTHTGDVAAGTNIFEHILVANFKRNQIAKRNELKTMACNELVVVFMDSDFDSTGTSGNTYVMGLEVKNNVGGADVTTSTISTGASLAESNALSITLRSLETQPILGIAYEDWEDIVAGNAVN